MPLTFEVTVGTPPQRKRWSRWLLAAVAVVVAGVVGGGWFLATHGPAPLAGADEPSDPPAGPQVVTVEVVNPRPGGIERVCVQPGTVEPFESADLYAKVSGFLAEQAVDIGSRVKKGQVLARISVPEFEKAVQRDKAKVSDTNAQVKQMEARVTASQASARAARAHVALAEAEVKSKAAYRAFRKKQLDRVRELSEQQAVDGRLVDEKEDQYEAALAAELAAKEQVNAAREEVAAAEAKVLQSQADLDEARAEVGVAEAELDKSKVWLDYTTITSPYDGVITRRTFNRGDFIRAADAGGVATPLFSVDRTDLMRVIVQVPDRDVSYVNAGDPATLEIDALPGRAFKTVISRCAEAEDPATRLMRTEMDIPNTDGRLRRGMYGRATLVLDKGPADAVRVPSAAVAEKGDDGRATVRVVRDGRVHVARVQIGTDNGAEVEVTGGLAPADEVIVRATGPVAEGSEVTVAPQSGRR